MAYVHILLTAESQLKYRALFSRISYRGANRAESTVLNHAESQQYRLHSVSTAKCPLNLSLIGYRCVS